jgi:hypothetical protein
VTPRAELPAADHHGIDRLVAAYADTVTRRAWDELVDLFTPDAVVHIDTVTRPAFEVVGPVALGEFIGGAVERFDFFEFVPLNLVTWPDPDGRADRAGSRLHMCEIRRNATDAEWTTAYGRYDDTVIRHGGHWRFAGRRYRSLGRTGADGGVFPVDPDHDAVPPSPAD